MARGLPWDDTMMTVKEVAEHLGVSKGLIYKLVSNGELESYRVGSTIRITPDQVRDYLQRSREDDRPGGFNHLKL
jgi:excisionase family DNA binding protein